jgi:hypothetical protein
MAKPAISIPSLTQIEIGLTKLAAVAAGVEGSTDLGGLPKPIRVTLLAVSGVIIAINHWFNKTTTTAPLAPVTPPASKS